MNVLMEEEIRFWLEKCVLMYDLGPGFKVMRSSTFHFIPNAVRDVTERYLNWNGSQKEPWTDVTSRSFHFLEHI